jgi:transcription elongation factor SPT4
MEPSKSWVARWQRVDKLTKGMYAIRVTGRLSPAVEDQLKAQGISYRPRDGSVQD